VNSTKKTGLPEQMEDGVQDRAWMDEILMLEWIKKVVKPATQHNRFSYLILDECHSHLTVKVKAAFASCNTELDLILAGYTSRLQLMDVGTNKPFKG
jgi:DDE superfamily endonuclease